MKLPKNYVPGVGVQRATGYGGVGQRMLERMGWQEGQGLGKSNHGMKDALDVKEKKDTLGVGAAGGWDWSLKFWDEAYNSAMKRVKTDISASTSSSSSDDEAENARLAQRAQRGTGPGAKQHAANSRGSATTSTSTSASSSSGSSGSDSDNEGDEAATGGAGVHRDGTAASAATAAELAIAAALAKDPWGRWGGRGGKMARIRQQEMAEAAKARQRLGLPAPAAAAAAAANGAAQAAPTAQQPAKQRTVIVLTVRDDPSFQRAPFVPTPRTGWWGASYFMSVGALEGMEEAAEQQGPRERKSFNEDDQASLYMQVLNNQRVGHKGLGKSTTVNVAGGKWAGTRKTFGEEEEAAGKQEARGAAEASLRPPDELDDGQGSGTPAVGTDGPKLTSSKKRKRARGQGQDDAAAQGQVLQSGLPVTEGGSEEEGTTGQEGMRAQGQPDAVPAAAPQATVASRIKWLKVAKVLLKKAPKRRLKLEKLCKKLLEHVHAHPAPIRTYSHEDVSAILHRKARKSKVLITDGMVRLPA